LDGLFFGAPKDKFSYFAYEKFEVVSVGGKSGRCVHWSLLLYFKHDNGDVVLVDMLMVFAAVEVFDFFGEGISDGGKGFVAVFENDVVHVGIVNGKEVVDSIGVDDDTVFGFEGDFLVLIGKMSLESCWWGFFNPEKLN